VTTDGSRTGSRPAAVRGLLRTGRPSSHPGSRPGSWWPSASASCWVSSARVTSSRPRSASPRPAAGCAPRSSSCSASGTPSTPSPCRRATWSGL